MDIEAMEGEIYTLTLAAHIAALQDPECSHNDRKEALAFMKQYGIEGNRSTSAQEEALADTVGEGEGTVDLQYDSDGNPVFHVA